MTRDQFISWLKGFTAAVEETPTKGQWETIVSELNKIQECIDWNSPIGVPYTPPTWQDPYFPNPLDKYKITCETGVVNANGNTETIITDGFIQNSTITRANPPSTLTTTSNGKPVTYTITNDSKDS